MKKCYDDIDYVYKGFRINIKTHSIYNEFKGKPYFYNFKPNSIEEAMRWIDDKFSLAVSTTISNLCQEITLPKEMMERAHFAMDITNFKNHIESNKTVNTMLLTYEPDPSKWWILDEESGQFTNEIIHMLFSVYTSR